MSRQPVLLIHGVDDSSRRFRRMITALKEQAPQASIHTVDIVPNNGSISVETMGQQVLSAAHRLEEAASGAKIDLVGFSMGALAARYFLQRLGGKHRVRRFISISGPNHGTLTAYLRPGQGIRQMRPGSPLLEDLNADPDPWGEVEVFSFWSRLDLTIIPPSSSALVYSEQRVFNVLLHPLMITDREVIQAVVQALL